jgi:hypothetical protein
MMSMPPLGAEMVGRAAAAAAVDEPLEANWAGGPLDPAAGVVGAAGEVAPPESTRGGGEVFGVNPPGGE